MEAAKKKRTQQRRLFSKACNEFDAEETNLEISDKIIKLTVIKEKATLMLNAEENVKQFLFSENVEDDVIEKEIDESETYIDRWQLLQFKLKQLSFSERERPFFRIVVFIRKIRYYDTQKYSCLRLMET